MTTVSAYHLGLKDFVLYQPGMSTRWEWHIPFFKLWRLRHWHLSVIKMFFVLYDPTHWDVHRGFLTVNDTHVYGRNHGNTQMLIALVLVVIIGLSVNLIVTLNSRILLAHKALLHFRNINWASLSLDNLFFCGLHKSPAEMHYFLCDISASLMYGTDVHNTESRDWKPGYYSFKAKMRLQPLYCLTWQWIGLCANTVHDTCCWEWECYRWCRYFLLYM